MIGWHAYQTDMDPEDVLVIYTGEPWICHCLAGMQDTILILAVVQEDAMVCIDWRTSPHTHLGCTLCILHA